MLSVGAHLVVRLLAVFSVVIAIVLIALYLEFGVLGLTTVIGVSGISILGIMGFFASTWDKLKGPLTERLEYLNQHAFSPLVEWSGSLYLDRINPSFEAMSSALADLKTHRRYMTVGLYPKTLLNLTDRVVKNTAEYLPLWNDIYQTNMDWIQGAHFNEWVKHSTMPDMRMILFALDLSSPGISLTPDPEVMTLVNGFLSDYKRKKPEELARFVLLSKDLQEQKSALLSLLDGYMRTNMLQKHRSSARPA
jgi:hypothetical protein